MLLHPYSYTEVNPQLHSNTLTLYGCPNRLALKTGKKAWNWTRNYMTFKQVFIHAFLFLERGTVGIKATNKKRVAFDLTTLNTPSIVI